MLSFQASESSFLDLTTFDQDLRGFSFGFSVAHFGYFVPFMNKETNYFGKLVKLNLRTFTTARASETEGIADDGITIKVLDLRRADSRLGGFSGAFTAGQYAFLSPWRNVHEPINGMRGFGLVVRIDLNDFSIDGVKLLDMPSTIRNQIPSYPDSDLRGFSACFPCF